MNRYAIPILFIKVLRYYTYLYSKQKSNSSSTN